MGIERSEDGDEDPSQKADAAAAQGHWPSRGRWPFGGSSSVQRRPPPR